MKRKQWTLAAMAAGTALAVWGTTSLPAVREFVGQVKRNPPMGETFSLSESGAIAAWETRDLRLSQQDEQLLTRIKSEAANRKIAPVNAKVDRVWKAIPGYNGVEVDVEETFTKAKAKGLSAEDPIPFVYREVEPQVKLEDLGAQPIYKGNPNKPMVSLMINVAWGDEFLPSMIEILKREKVHATFFFDGSWLKKNVDMARVIGKEGHELSNHAYSHPNMSRLSRASAVDEIAKTQSILEKELNVHNRLFAPPSGDFDKETIAVAHEQGLKTVLWTLDTVDWKNPEPGSVVRKIAARVEPGSLILMHPTRSSSLALEGMIQEIKRKGLVLGTVSELLSSKRVYKEDEGRGSAAAGN